MTTRYTWLCTLAELRTRLRNLVRRRRRPRGLLVEVTAQCNLHCTGCYVPPSMGDEIFDGPTLSRLVAEARAAGIGHLSLLGGEPLLRLSAILAAIDAHPGTPFTITTNGTLLDDAVADELARRSNLGILLSLDDRDGDDRRGPCDRGSIRDLVEAAAWRLSERAVFHGAAVRVHRDNFTRVVDRGFVHWLGERGCAVVVYAPALPPAPGAVGLPALDADQRRRLVAETRRMTMTTGILCQVPCDTGDGGCAGGVTVAALDASGHAMPCPHLRRWVDRWPERTLTEILDGPFFGAFHALPPPADRVAKCFVTDRQDEWRRMLDETG